MKHQNLLPLFLVSALLTSLPARADDIGTGFTYQGELLDGGAPVTGECDVEFTLWDDPVAGAAVGPVVAETIELAEGEFTTVLDFGPGVLSGDARWLEIKVCCPSPCSPAFTTLSPRQELTPAPHAVRAVDGVGPPNALEVDPVTGFVGIGTGTPSLPLTVNGPIRSIAGGFMLPDGTVLDAAADLGSGDITAVTAGTGLTGGGTSGGVTLNAAYAGTGLANTSARSDHYHSTLAASDGSPSNAVSVDAAGNVGIGTTTPDNTLLHVGTGDGTLLKLGDEPELIFARDVASGKFTINLGGTNYNGKVLQIGRNDGNHDIGLTGNVGIGTNSPSATLDVVGGLEVDGGTLFVNSSLNRVGVGTTAPDVKLHVSGGSDASLGGGGYLTLGSTTGTNVVIDDNEILARSSSAAATLTLNTEGGDVHLIPTGTGDVGIGTNSPTEKLHVNGNLRVNGTVSIPTTTGYASFHHSIWVPGYDELEYVRVIGESTRIWGFTGLGVDFYAPLQLPHGSTITAAQVKVYDVSVADPEVYLYRSRLTDDNNVYLASAHSVGTPGATVLTMSSINETVDNSLYSYYMVVQYIEPSAGVYGVGGIRITYTMNTLRP